MGIRTGEQYIQGLNSPREVWLDGRRIENIAQHPAFSKGVMEVARLYDLQCEGGLSQGLTYQESDGAESAITFRIPRTREDLAARRKAVQTSSRSNFGMLGRSPDFFNTAIAAFAGGSEFFSRIDPSFGRNVLNFYDHVRTNNLFLTRATIPPQVDRSRPSSEQSDAYSNARVVKETSDGLIIRGAKMISTNAPIADELLVFPLPGLQPGDEPYALSFCIPISSPGLRFVCREPFDGGKRSHFNHPMSSRFEEIDATCIFEDVLVPWDRLFFYGSVEVANVLYGETMARNHAGHQAMCRSVVKSELLVGVALALAESSKTSAFLHVQQMLGEMIGDLEIARALVDRSEIEATTSEWGNMCPAMEPINAFRYCFPRINARAVEIIQTLAGGSLFSAPSEADLASPIAEDILRYFKGASSSATDRIALLKLAWDVTGDAFGQRQMLYEKYHAGDPVRIAAAQFISFDKTALLEAVADALMAPDASSMPTSAEPLSTHRETEPASAPT